MTGEGLERFTGFMNGVFTVSGSGTLGTPIEIRIPFMISMHLEKTKDHFKGTYSFEANPFVLQPRSSLACPGVFGILPEGEKMLPSGSSLSGAMLLAQVLTVPPIKKNGDIEVVKYGNRQITVKLLDLPQKFMIQASAVSWRVVPNSDPLQMEISPVVGAYGFDLGFFSKSSPKFLDALTLDFNLKQLGFQKSFKDQAQMDYPSGGLTQFVGEATIAKTESFYSVVEGKGATYVEQVAEVEEARKLFLEHPELYDQIQKMGDAETQRGVNEGLIEAKHAHMFSKDEAPVRTPAPEADAMMSRSVVGTTGSPLEGLVYGIEQLIALGQEGYNTCMLVVDGCWVNVTYKPKKKQLYLQVAGDKYISKKSRLGPEHIKILDAMGITREPASIDIFSAYYSVDTVDIPKFAQDFFRIFDEVLRVSKGSKAYLQLDLVNKPTPEYEAVLIKMATMIPDRKEKKKFYWAW
jgi:hypothetical protein